MTGSARREVVDRKARLAGNGPVLVKRRNTVSDCSPFRPKGAIQMTQSASPKAPTLGAALGKDWAIACGLRLVLNHLDSSEPVIITLKEH